MAFGRIRHATPWVPGLGVVLALYLSPAVDAARAETGACCPSCFLEECVITTQEDCEALRGHYQGDGTTCWDCPIVDSWVDPSNCEVIPADALNGLFVGPPAPAPAPATTVLVVVRSVTGHTMCRASVAVEFIAANPTCDGSTFILGTTNEAGEVSLVLPAGGCTENVVFAGTVKANGVTIRNFQNVKSPDVDANGLVELGDLVSFSNEFLGTEPSGCHDYDNDGTTSLSDLVLFSPLFVAVNHCP